MIFMRTHIAIILPTMLFVGMLLGALCADAQPIDKRTIREVPEFSTQLSENDFLKQTRVVEERPVNDRYLSFRIQIPDGWTRIGGTLDDAAADVEEDATNKLDVRVSRRVLGQIVRYVGEVPFEASSRVQIDALEMDYEISAHNWFLEYTLKNGFILQGMKETDQWNVEALYTVIEDSIPFVVRTRAIMNGPRIMLVSYYVPEIRFEKEKSIQDRVIDSFVLLEPHRVNVESRRTYAFLDLVRFDYPAAWRLIAPNISSIDGMDAQLVNTRDKKTLQGEINVRIVSRDLQTSLPLEVQYLKEKIRSIGLEVGELMETEDKFEFHPHINFARVEVYNAKPRDKRVQDHEYWLAIMAEDRYYYIISMLTPSRESDFFTWARNSEAYEIVIESIRP